jgi:hypothetical protein
VAGGFLDATGEGEELLLLVERSRGASPRGDAELAASIRRTVLERTGVRPGRIQLLAPGTLPRTSSGKLRRAEAVRRYRSGDLVPPGRSDPLSLTGQLVRSALGFLLARWRT